MTNTNTTDSTISAATEALAAWRHTLDTCEPLTDSQALQLNQASNAGDAQRDMIVGITALPRLTAPAVTTGLTNPDATSPMGQRLLDGINGPGRPIPSSRIDQAVSQLDRIAGAQPDQQAEPYALQASLYWLDGRYTAALERALTALQKDPDSRLGSLMRLCVVTGTASPWSTQA